MTETKIGPAARRICRTVRTSHRQETIYFDAGGNEVDRKFGPEGFGPVNGAFYVSWPGASKAKLATIQAYLDAMAEEALPKVGGNLAAARSCADEAMGMAEYPC